MATKINEKGIQLRASAIIDRRKKISRIEKIGSVVNHEGWQIFAGLLQDGVETRDRMIKSLIVTEREYPADELKLLLREHRVIRDTLLGVIDLIKDPTVEVKRLNDEISQYESEIKEAEIYGGGE